MWINARDAHKALAALPELQAASARVPMRWFNRCREEAERAGKASATRAKAGHLFDMGAAAKVVEAFLAEHAPADLPVRPDASDFEIVLKARKIAGDVQLRTLGLTADDSMIVCMNACAAYGVAMPRFEKAADKVARVRCELWWRRQLRKNHIRALEHSNIRLHYVHYKKDPYASNDAVKRRRAQNARNAATLAGVTLENEEGHRFTLAELAAKTIANKALRRGELMTRLRGCEDLADSAGFAGVMFTLTCPSRFHAVRQVGPKSSMRFIPNKKYAGTNPRDAQAYLRKVFSRIRAKLARLGITYFGMRVAEPHHDSTPHWHGLVFTNDIDGFCRVMRAYGLADEPNEKGAQERRVKFEVIDRARGSAVGYVAKYIAKNIDGHAVGEHKTGEGYVVQADMLGDDEITPSARVEAWAATWGIRQFQQFGGAPVGVWRELRRVKEEDLPDATESPEILAAWRAAQKTEGHRADWAEYSRAMGGIAGEKRLIYVKRMPAMREGRYGITSVLVPHGVAARGIAQMSIGICNYSVETEIFVPATRHEWKVVQRSAEGASTRTCVNNCTGGGDGSGGKGGEKRGGGAARSVRTAHAAGKGGGIEANSGGGAAREGRRSHLTH
ncbi:replication endonuclease [Paraburkholderia tropica]|uniref:replication endonuclease n=1 Tax=Paraburkholderia tropica TaxID=92647 RepID=UPI002ABD513F|nr:replication endonuclease [Paraburkholderia tropica]